MIWKHGFDKNLNPSVKLTLAEICKTAEKEFPNISFEKLEITISCRPGLGPLPVNSPELSVVLFEKD